jgi:hypothetical protein
VLQISIRAIDEGTYSVVEEGGGGEIEQLEDSKAFNQVSNNTIYIIDASAYVGSAGGLQFEGYALPSSRPGAFWLSVSIFLSYLVGTLWAECIGVYNR